MVGGGGVAGRAGLIMRGGGQGGRGGVGGAQETGIHIAPELSRPATSQVVVVTNREVSADTPEFGQWEPRHQVTIFPSLNSRICKSRIGILSL